MKSWLDNFDDRQNKEIVFCEVYVKDFNHGTDGHNAKLIIAKMAELLDKVQKALLSDNFDVEKAKQALGIENDN
jgi:hypothetical protein